MKILCLLTILTSLSVQAQLISNPDAGALRLQADAAAEVAEARAEVEKQKALELRNQANAKRAQIEEIKAEAAERRIQQQAAQN